MTPDPHGPKHLGKLFGFMQRIVHDRPVQNHAKRVPCKVCPICGIRYDFHMLHSIPAAREDLCSNCTHNLKEGMTAVIETNGKRFAWFSNAPKEMQSKVIKCATSEDFERLTNRGNPATAAQ